MIPFGIAGLARRCPLVIAATAGIACSGRVKSTSTSTPRVDPPACYAIPERATPADSINVVFTSPISVDAAPAPSTPAEQFVFAHAYETLLRIGCRGVLEAGLAKSWSAIEGTDRWRLVLSPDARFWSGVRVTAGDVVATWRTTGQRPAAALARHLAGRATVVDDTTLDLRLGPTPVRALGSEELAVARRTPGSRWPEGSGRYRIDDSRPRTPTVPGRTTVTLAPLVTGLPRVVVQATSASDARDLVDLGTDLLITDDRALSTYVGSRTVTAWHALDMAAWSWVVVSRGSPGSFDRSPPYGIPGPTSVGDQEAYKLSASLAADVVRVHARPTGGTFWSRPRAPCDSMAIPQPTSPPSSLAAARVVYRADEPIARAIAERVVALASSGDHRVGFLAPGVARAGDRVSAAALTPKEFAAALRQGQELAFIVPIRRHPNLGCVESHPLFYQAPWVVDSALSKVPSTIASLIETRPMAYVFTDRARFSPTDGGTLLLFPIAAGPENRR